MAEFHPLRSLARPSDTDHTENVKWNEWNNHAMELAASQPRAPLPSLDHVSYRDYEYVYEPSDDTYLLLDAIHYELKQVQRSKFCTETDVAEDSNEGHDSSLSSPIICVEIGCGTAVASVSFRTQWMSMKETRDIPLHSYVTDINPKALEVALQTFAAATGTLTATSIESPFSESQPNQHQPTTTSTVCNDDAKTTIHAVHCDLVSALIPQLDHSVHFVLFNPPYVPTPDADVVDYGSSSIKDGTTENTDSDGNIIQAAWAGGVRGRRVVDRAVPYIARILQQPHGVAYLVTVDDNEPAQLATELASASLGLRMQPLFRRQARNEFLTIQKISWM